MWWCHLLGMEISENIWKISSQRDVHVRCSLLIVFRCFSQVSCTRCNGCMRKMSEFSTVLLTVLWASQTHPHYHDFPETIVHKRAGSTCNSTVSSSSSRTAGDLFEMLNTCLDNIPLGTKLFILQTRISKTWSHLIIVRCVMLLSWFHVESSWWIEHFLGMFSFCKFKVYSANS